MFPYECFIGEIRRYGIRQFDADHILIPPMTKTELEKTGRETALKGKNHMDAYGLFLVIHAIREWEEMSWREYADDRTCLFSDFFLGEFSMEYFQRIADRIKDDFKPLSDHPELNSLGDFPLRMAYVHKNQEALLIVGQESVCFMLLTKTAAGSGLLEKVQEQTGLAFHVGF